MKPIQNDYSYKDHLNSEQGQIPVKYEEGFMTICCKFNLKDIIKIIIKQKIFLKIEAKQHISAYSKTIEPSEFRLTLDEKLL